MFFTFLHVNSYIPLGSSWVNHHSFMFCLVTPDIIPKLCSVLCFGFRFFLVSFFIQLLIKLANVFLQRVCSVCTALFCSCVFWLRLLYRRSFWRSLTFPPIVNKNIITFDNLWSACHEHRTRTHGELGHIHFFIYLTCVLHTARIGNVDVAMCGERIKDGKF